MKFTETHEWIKIQNDNIAVVGVSNHAQEELGEIVYVELPQIGKNVQAGKESAVLESTKAAADVYAPVSGKIISINQELSSSPELVNASPEDKGWLYTIELSNLKELDKLMDKDAYLSSLK